MGNSKKARLAVNVTVGASSGSGSYNASYSGTGTASGSGITAPDVDTTGNINIYEDTNVTFTLETSGFAFPATGTLVTIGGVAFAAGTSGTTFSIGSDQPTNSGLDLELEDDDADGDSSGVTHPYNLHVTHDGHDYTLDPNFYNKN
jgi:hypothetical protein